MAEGDVLYQGGDNGHRKLTQTESGVQFTDYSTTVIRRMQDGTKIAADAVAQIAVEAVQKKILWGYDEPHGPPGEEHTEIVDTEALFDSITASVNRITAGIYQTVVGSDKHYAIYVHEGYTQPAGLRFQGKDGQWYTTKGRTIAGRPFISDGLAAAQADIEAAIRQAIRDAMASKT